ncbi:MAG: urease accessory protein, partial [Streptosporangiaceae bacterium]|nr:urease accessory protein [Streptosporangiaceae bacterium]
MASRADAAGRTRITVLRSDGPLALRETPLGVYLVGTAAGPLGGYDLTLDIDVGPGSCLVIRSA